MIRKWLHRLLIRLIRWVLGEPILLTEDSDYKIIDWGLRTLIRELNKVGLITKGCCVGHAGGQAYISFELRNRLSVNASENSIGLYWDYKGKKFEERLIELKT